MNTKKNGFTVIELLIAMVVLAIIAVIALPKFINLRAETKVASMESIGGAMHEGLKLVYSVAVIEGKENGSQTIDINGVEVPIYDGYPSVKGSDSFVKINDQVKAWLDIDTVDRDTAKEGQSSALLFTDKNSSDNQILIFFTADVDSKSSTYNCHVLYENSEKIVPSQYSISVNTDNCE